MRNDGGSGKKGEGVLTNADPVSRASSGGDTGREGKDGKHDLERLGVLKSYSLHKKWIHWLL